VVGRDEREQGERRKLNFGHTLGHAVERTLGVAHGEAVSVGMAFAAALSVRRGLLTAGEFDRILGLMRALRLPCRAAVDPSRLVMNSVVPSTARPPTTRPSTNSPPVAGLQDQRFVSVAAAWSGLAVKKRRALNATISCGSL